VIITLWVTRYADIPREFPMSMHKKSAVFLILLYIVLFGLSAVSLPVSSIDITGFVPVSESFTINQDPKALNFNLAESRDSEVHVGTYTLISNNTQSLFHLYIKPGEDGKGSRFAFFLDNPGSVQGEKKTELPFLVKVLSNLKGAESTSGNTPMEKDIGILGVYAGNDEIVYETGEILAQIPDFVPDDYATGWYSAAIQLSIEVH
jgi:hypothetical protein